MLIAMSLVVFIDLISLEKRRLKGRHHPFLLLPERSLSKEDVGPFSEVTSGGM